MRRHLLFILLLLLLVVTSRPSVAANPQLTFSGLWGGDLADEGRAIASDPAGSLYIAGMSQSNTLPTALQAPEHGVDAFVAKISADGRTIDYVFWFNAISASDVDESFGIALAPDGGPIVVGHTRSADFCTLFGDVPGYDPTYNDNSDAFAFKIKPDGSGLAYCTFLGGSDWDIATAVTTTPDGSAILTGGTWSADFPTTADAAQPTLGGQRDAFVAILSPDGMALTHATFLGGSGQDEARAIVYDASGRTIVGGWTSSANFPTRSAAQPDFGGEFDAFATAFDPNGRITSSTYLGSEQAERATAVLPTPSGLIVAGSAPADGIVWRLSPDGDALLATRLLGGSGDDTIRGADVTPSGDLLLVGTTTSSDFPTTAAAIQPDLAGLRDAFVARLTPDALHLTYGSYLGGGVEDRALAVVAHANGRFTTTGTTRSPDFPTTPASFGPMSQGDYDLFATQWTLPPTFEMYVPLAIRAGFALE